MDFRKDRENYLKENNLVKSNFIVHHKRNLGKQSL